MKKFLFLLNNDEYENYVDYVLKNQKKFYSYFHLINEMCEYMKNIKYFRLNYYNYFVEKYYIKEFSKEFLMNYYEKYLDTFGETFFWEFILNKTEIRTAKKIYFFYKKFNNFDEIKKEYDNIVQNFMFYTNILRVKNNFFIYKDGEKYCIKKAHITQVSEIVEILYRKGNKMIAKNLYTGKKRIEAELY